MRGKIINYYAVIMLILFIIYNLFLKDLKIYGLLYNIVMFLLIIVNVIILIVFRKKIKLKTLVIISYLLLWICSKNMLQFLFCFSNIILLCITKFRKKASTKLLYILFVIFGYIFFLPLFFGFLLVVGTGLNEEKGINDIYDDTHYYCDNNYEVYAYSTGAIDSFHYSIGRYYEILNVDGIINVSYNERNEKTYDEYKEYLDTHNCKLVGGINGSK